MLKPFKADFVATELHAYTVERNWSYYYVVTYSHKYYDYFILFVVCSLVRLLTILTPRADFLPLKL